VSSPAAQCEWISHRVEREGHGDGQCGFARHFSCGGIDAGGWFHSKRARRIMRAM
jgi:hypothetical protein